MLLSNAHHNLIMNALQLFHDGGVVNYDILSQLIFALRNIEEREGQLKRNTNEVNEHLRELFRFSETRDAQRTAKIRALQTELDRALREDAAKKDSLLAMKEKELTEMKESLEKTKEELETEKATLAKTKSECSILNDQLAQRTVTIDELNALKTSHLSTISVLALETERNKHDIRCLKQQLTEDEKSVTELTTALRYSEGKLAALQKGKEALLVNVAELKSKLRTALFNSNHNRIAFNNLVAKLMDGHRKNVAALAEKNADTRVMENGRQHKQLNATVVEYLRKFQEQSKPAEERQPSEPEEFREKLVKAVVGERTRAHQLERRLGQVEEKMQRRRGFLLGLLFAFVCSLMFTEFVRAWMSVYVIH